MVGITRKIAVLAAAICATYAANGFAQVQVVDSNNRLINSSRPSASIPAASSDVNAQLFYQLQVLQQEVSQLRGQVEEQAYELKRLKQQRLDDYVDFDRRLSAMQGQSATASSSSDTETGGSLTTATASQQPVSTMSADSDADELQSYRTAIDLVLRQKDYGRAVSAFQQHLAQFPNGRYAANCQYWLGEIYLLQNDLEKAREWFSRLLAEHADHAKAPDATYKLGTVYDKLGDKTRARQLLLKVAGGDTNAARLASAYLAEMDK